MVTQKNNPPKTTTLPPCSPEQSQIVTLLQDANNVIVDAVAGSGKTTSILYIAQEFPTAKILLLTYNAKLKLETRQKVKRLGLTNIETHSYHSFCVKYYDNKCYTDASMIRLLDSPDASDAVTPNFDYDLLILDEAQDITPLYYELICKIFRDASGQPKLCLLGDKNQSIFTFNQADQRFITYAQQLFQFNDLNWQTSQLPISFRVTTEMAEFVNNCMLGSQRIRSHKTTGHKPRYIVCNCFEQRLGELSRTFQEVCYYLNLGYQPSDIFILAPSVRNPRSPVRILENNIKLMLNVPVYVPVSDDEKLDGDILKNKLVFSTFHQTKGLERKVVLVFNFDQSYFRYYAGLPDDGPPECPNVFYVAATRASEHLSLFHHYENDYLPFLNRDLLANYCYLDYETKLRVRKVKLSDTILNTAVTNLVRHLPQRILDKCMQYLHITKIKKGKIIDIPTKTKQKYGYEGVSEITGTAIPAFLEYLLTSKMTILDSMQLKGTNLKGGIRVSRSNCRGAKGRRAYNLQNIDLTKLTEETLLYIANEWCAFTSGYIFKIDQINNYNWLTRDNLRRCIRRLRRLGISGNTKFEQSVEAENETELLNRKLSGYIDCIDRHNVYEIKCVGQLETEHYLQLAVYMYLYELGKQKGGGGPETPEKTNYYLYNILTDELEKLECELADLRKMMEFLIQSKYAQTKKMTNEAFVAMVKDIGTKYV